MIKPFKLTLKLKKDASPHLGLFKIKEMIKNDSSLHPFLERNLKLMKKTHMPYVLLALEKEIIYNCDELYHLDRGVKPNLTGWFKIDWNEEEIKDYKKDNKKFIKESLDLFDKIGYNIISNEDLSLEDVNKIVKLIKPFKKK